MIIHHLLIALRHIRRNKLYSIINISCLAIGIAVAMTIMLYVLHERSYDRWHANASRIFSVSTASSFGTETFSSTRVSYLTGPGALLSSPAVEGMTRTANGSEAVELQNPDMPQVRFREGESFLYADSNFFQFFSFRLLRGRPAEVLVRPFTVVLTETAARKYFGNTDPVGKTLMLDSGYRLEVTGVAADVPSNSTIRFELVASLATMREMKKSKDFFTDQQLQSGVFSTWLLLKRAADTAQAGLALSHMALTAAGKVRMERGGDQESHRFTLLPIGDTHLKVNTWAGNSRYLAPLSLAAGVVLLLALVNYMSLATARAAARAGEVGVRKVLGADRKKIAAQFYIESALFGVISFVLGGLFFLCLRPYFCNLMHLPIDTRFLFTPMVLGFFGVLLVVVVVVAGSYPSLVLSGYRPVAVLYGKLSRERSGERIRKGFIMLQFTLSMALVSCSFVIGKQLFHLRHMDTGVSRENVVTLPFEGTIGHYGAYKREVAALPSVQQVGTSISSLYTGMLYMVLLKAPGTTVPMNLSMAVVDSPLIRLLGLKWVQAPPQGSTWYDKDHLLLNEAAMEAAGLTGNVIGQKLLMGEKPVTVAGVLKNFNFNTLRVPISPFGIEVASDPDKEWGSGIGGCLYVRIGPHTNVPTVIEAIKKIYSKYDARTPFSFQFLDEAFNSDYKMEDRLADLMTGFTVITILIACLGLFALATFAARQRVREIGIRKVLGASVASIGTLLSRDFLRPVLLAILIASPLSWWLMNNWLQDFAYRTPLSWWIFPAAGLGLLAVALTTVIVRTLKAARANPVDNLRAE